jgi:hypothetical protein
MSEGNEKRTLREFKDGPGTRGPIVRETTPQVIPDGSEGPGRPDVVDLAEENLTDLGEQEAAAEAENESAEQDSAEAAEQPLPGSISGECPPAGYRDID